ncbi:MAG: hypothetical protein JO247_20090 [Chloroflexi bacterium]|nr:hypothetical protein [Chloroflexota bacterium]
MLKLIVRALTVLTTVLFALLLTPVMAADSPPDYPIPGGHYYTQGSGTTTGGFSLTDDGGIPMWSEYNRLGGVDELGYPVSGRFVFEGHVVQLLQRAGLMWHPELGEARFFDIFSTLHAQGRDGWLLSSKGIPQQVAGDVVPGKSWDQVSQERYSLLDSHPAVKTAYFATRDPVNTYGLPTSNWLEQPVVSVLRFDNVVFQLWKQLVPWAAAGTVQLANGGELLKDSGLLGPVPFALQAPPQPQVFGTPAGFAIISFYADFFQGRHTATGAVFDQNQFTAATNSFALGTKLKLSTPDGSRSVVVVNNDRPAAWNTRIDLSKAAFEQLYPLGAGIGSVKVEVVH